MTRTDRLLADLERGFEALEDGKLDAAANILERCRRIDRKNPDVITLAAAVADARGDVEEALAQYHELVALRPDDPMPRICIARLELHAIGDADAALETVDAAFDFIDEEADLVEAIFVKTEALLARSEPERAREVLGELSSSVLDDPGLALELAELALAAEDVTAAKRWIDVARRDEALEADAMHLLGMVHEQAGDHAAMVAAWQEVRRLDAALPKSPITLDDDEVERVALEALDELPAEVRKRLENVPIVVADLPTEELIADGFDPRSLGVFQGNAMRAMGGEERHLDGDLAPSVTNILLFMRNLEASAEDEDHLREEIRITVLHETAHYFGLDEDDLERLGLD